MHPFKVMFSEGLGRSELRIEGEFDLAVAKDVDDRLAQVEEGTILVDLTACEFIDSSGIAVLLNTDARLRRQGGRLALFGATKQVKRVLEVSGLAQSGLVFESASEALELEPNTA
jgi:anti-anti-sigma factor